MLNEFHQVITRHIFLFAIVKTNCDLLRSRDQVYVLNVEHQHRFIFSGFGRRSNNGRQDVGSAPALSRCDYFYCVRYTAALSGAQQ